MTLPLSLANRLAEGLFFRRAGALLLSRTRLCLLMNILKTFQPPSLSYTFAAVPVFSLLAHTVAASPAGVYGAGSISILFLWAAVVAAGWWAWQAGVYLRIPFIIIAGIFEGDIVAWLIRAHLPDHSSKGTPSRKEEEKDIEKRRAA